MNKVGAREVREKYIKFFKSAPRNHQEIPSSSLVIEDDPTTLFTSAGMQPLIPYLLGESHPLGKRLVNYQKCLRTDDIDEVGDPVHHTYFEMLGNWSLGDYFKKEAINWSFEFLTAEEWLNIPKEKLAVSVFAGDKDASFDEESYKVWISLGFPEDRIAKLPKKNNWWGPAGATGPCGPDTEMFYWTKKGKAPDKFDPEDSAWVEIWNDVFMQFNKVSEDRYELLQQKNVDTGMGLERTLAILNGLDDNYLTDLFLPAIKKIELISGKKYEDSVREFRIIADHLRAVVFLADDAVEPANKGRGYILRRLIRRSAVQLKRIGVKELEISANEVASVFIDLMSPFYPSLENNRDLIIGVVQEEIARFNTTLENGLKEFGKLKNITGKEAFDLFQTYGFPWEITAELARENGIDVNKEDFEKEFEKHKDQSRTTSAGVFKGGLADQSEEVVKLHTATHLLLANLRKVLGEHVVQKGQNITKERSRFDFPHPQKLTDGEIEKVEKQINELIDKKLPVKFEVMPKDDALKTGAIHAFNEKYADTVKVYYVGENMENAESREFCGGPHVGNTSEIGHVKIKKQEKIGAGLLRIYLLLE